MINSMVFVLAGLAFAYGAVVMGPLQTLRARDLQIREILGQSEQRMSPDREERLRTLVSDIVDYEAYARDSFGIYWTQLADRDRGEAVRLLRTLVERSLMGKLDDYVSEAVQYVSENFDPEDPNAALVLTHVLRENEQWEIGYRMRQSEGRWRIVDIVVQGASSTEKNRLSFYREIHGTGLASLLEKLRKKAEAAP
jgi:phospholipid transport system substrate-binding protein